MRSIKFSTTLTDPQSGFQGHGIFEVKYLKLLFRDKVTIEH